MIVDKPIHQFHSVIDELKSLRKLNRTVDRELIGILDRVLKFEHLISQISAKFSNIDVSQVDKEIEHGLRLIVEFLQLDRSSFFEISPDKKQFISKFSFAHIKSNLSKQRLEQNCFPGHLQA